MGAATSDIQLNCTVPCRAFLGTPHRDCVIGYQPRLLYEGTNAESMRGENHLGRGKKGKKEVMSD